MCQVTVRFMENGDIAAVSKLEQEIFSQPWSEKGFIDALSAENTLFAVAGERQEIVGYCGMYLALDEGEITNVAVRNLCRRKGIGEAMLNYLLEEAGKKGIKTIFLEVRVSNREAIRLYEKLGFIKQGIRRDFYQKPKEDGFIMRYDR